MKTIKLLVLLLAGTLTVSKVCAQANASINILTLNSGNVGQGGVINIQVTVGNTGPVSNIAANKVRAQLSVPSALVSLLANAEQTGLPPGWTITVNTGSAITVCNGSDVIAPGTSRDIFIKIQGNTIGGPSTVSANLLFSSGTSCTTPGSLAGDNTADNSSTSSVLVYDPVPVTLTDFNAALVNCQPILKWTTENEINSDRFEIERSVPGNAGWTAVKVIAAKNTTSKTEYNFIDSNVDLTSARALYRLKMIDKDGRYEYSQVLPVFINCKNVSVNVYPNPVKDGKLYVSLNGADDQTEAILLSLSGQVIAKHKMNNGTNYMDVTNVAGGIYILSVTGPDGFDKKVKVIIQH